MKLLILADNNDFTWNGPVDGVDAIVSVGDLVDELILSAWDNMPCRAVMAVKGNHDAPGPFPDPIIDLHLHVHTFDGVRFGGLNGSWKYKQRGEYLYEQAEVATFLQDFPPVDVVVSHNSPRSVHDKNDGVHVGFDALLAYVHRHQPRLLFHGHQHVDAETTIGRTKVIGVYGYRIIEL